MWTKCCWPPPRLLPRWPASFKGDTTLAGRQKTAVLTHYGRSSGQAYQVTIWFALVDDQPWVGSQDRQRNWVRNVMPRGDVELDLGEGPKPYRLSPMNEARDIERFEKAVRAKYPFSSRVILGLSRMFGTVEPCAFRARPR